MNEQTGKKKVVKVDAPAPKVGADGKPERAWTPTPEAKKKATTLRIFSWVSWIVAIAIEVATIIWILPQASEKFWLLLVMLIPIAVLAIAGNLMWKQANRLDPASKRNAFKFFVQNQLGAFMTVLAFLPLIIVILLDKNLDGKQKAIAGGLGAVAMALIVVFTGISWDGGPSQEQYAEEEHIIMQLTGKDEVFWVKNGKVFHVCEHVPDVNRESKDGQIYQGTVAAAHEAGKERLSMRWASDAVNHCGYTQEQVDAVKAGLSVGGGSGDESPADDAETDDAEADGAESDGAGSDQTEPDATDPDEATE